MKPLVVTLCMAMLLGFTGCGEETVTVTKDAENVQTQQVAVGNVALNAPANWDITRHEDAPDRFPESVILLLTAPEPWGAGETFATVSVARETLPASLSSRKYAAAAINKTERDMVGFEQEEDVALEISGIPAELIRFRGKTAPEADTLEWQHLFVAKDGLGYVVSSTAPLDASDGEKALLKRIVTSFSFPESNN